MKVLIVDDEKLIRDVIKEYCIGNKYDVLEAENGVEAIEKAKVRNGCQLQVNMSFGCHSESLQCSSCNTPRIFFKSKRAC